MKTLIAAFVLSFGVFAGLPSAPAQILIDGFLNDTVDVVAPGSPSSVITSDIDDSNIDRQISVEVTGSHAIVSTVLDGFLVVDAGGSEAGSANAELEYLGFVWDLSENTFFEFTVGKVVGTPFLGLILENAASDQISGGLELTPSESTRSYFLDITQFAGYTPGFGSQLNSILVVIGGADESFFVEGDSFQFTSVPEPSSALLLVGGLLAAARRRRTP